MKDKLCSYYTNSGDITSYMVSRLGITENDVILEPSAGEGIFIDEILRTNKTVHIDALDIDKNAVSVLHRKYADNPAVMVKETDTLLDEQLDLYDTAQLWLKLSDTILDEELDFFASTYGHYTKVIGNPPYGAWQDYEKRDLLKKKYAGHYVKETYTLFLLRCVSVLRIYGRLSFIIPDTFLFLNMHSRLRKVLLTKTKIDEILIFPSKIFPGASFAYSNLSIITLERCAPDDASENEIRVIQGFRSAKEFSYAFDEDGALPKHLQLYRLKQKDILSNPQSRFILAANGYSNILKNCACSIESVADVVTGFYTGNNKEYICVLNHSVKGAKGYSLIDNSRVFQCTSNDGISSDKECYVPYIKSASKRRYMRERDDWFVRWDKAAIRHYNNDKKARFQNSSFYFKTGVGIPMVKSSVIRAFLMENRVFDQSIVGIFPKDGKYLPYILALMNSSVINDLIHIINPTANNSANYIKAIPFINPSDETLKRVNALVQKILSLLRDGYEVEAEKAQEEVNRVIREIYNAI